MIWRALSGALAVKDRLRTRGIQLDPTCPSCGSAAESICHVLFHCKYAKEVWSLSGIPTPPSGFSQNSVFLNLHYLLACSRKTSIPAKERLSFPWTLWLIWKARNSFLFEQVRLESSSVFERATIEADVWLGLNTNALDKPVQPVIVPPAAVVRTWSAPPSGWLKCNVGTSWNADLLRGGASWIIRDSRGVPLHHSRRAFNSVHSNMEASLQSLAWTLLALRDLRIKKVIVESSCEVAREALLHPASFPSHHLLTESIMLSLQYFDDWRLEHVVSERNQVASLIALSVTKEHRYQSYVARGGPAWLHSMIGKEAVR